MTTPQATRSKTLEFEWSSCIQTCHKYSRREHRNRSLSKEIDPTLRSQKLEMLKR